MQIYGLFSNAGAMKPTSTAASTGGDAISSEQKDPASLATLLGADTESSATRAATAKKKLDEIKQQLQALRFWASDPDTLARLAKQLAQQLGSAAQQLAGSGMTGADGSIAAVAGIATAASQASKAQAADVTSEANGQTSFVERAYREFAEIDARSGSEGRMVDEFKSVAEQLKQVLRKAEQDLRTEGAGRDADDARRASHVLSAAIGSLDGFGTGLAALGSAAPSSVSI
ncbi:hypothetical protein [Ensifer sp. MJa1]|uniref:hypothetical protein n=1 Tax=Ensifer sp. MJa1 TaxID=2919888 RepID=UPI00300899D4